ncbi:glycerol-3-phosphate dehydrogenase/oxidase [Ferruginibacter sp. SUN106]|uniref:glycerol-3-phosphate dehydrogenase/oxidase n=1 Tax=Ferruginibacter sp. SUN106 TaxID=2978348 RepID=UPI003D35F46B
MDRIKMLQQLNDEPGWDIIIIGGGATGLGTAVDAATRGYKTLLLEQHDFAKGTSSRSTKLVHGGVRYLAQGNIKLVREALKERGLLLKNAPHLSNNLSFVLPCYSIWQKIYYGVGLKLYDLMAGKLGLGKTKIINRTTAKNFLPTIDTKKLSGAIVYQDGQFDDARLAINLAQTAAENGAAVLNYCKVIRLTKKDDKVCGVVVQDIISGAIYNLQCKVVINATGIFTDEVLQMDDAAAKNIVSPSQGIHLVIDKIFFPGADAMMIPKTEDGRVLFAVPWHDKVVVGTTDTPIESHSSEPKPLEEEIIFILHHINKYLAVEIKRSDVKSVFVGLRPLVKKGSAKKTAIMPRDHTIIVSASGLVTITGGKWTTYRKMANDVLNNAVAVANLEKKICITENLKIHGYLNKVNKNDAIYYYGADAALVRNLCKANEVLSELIHPAAPNIKAEIIWAIKNEMAMTVEDVLARRTRLLFLDAKAAMEAAPLVAQLMAATMNKNNDWIEEQTNDFTALAKQYLLS